MSKTARTILTLCLLAAGAVLVAQNAVSPSMYSALRWRLIGPYRSGNVYAVAGVPGDPTTYYLGLPEGGVWKTTDGGTVWFPIFDQEHVPSIGSVAVAASDPDVIYVGTGDPTFWSFTPGQGVYKSSDGGRSWRQTGLENSQYLPALLVDPRNPNVVLAGALGPRSFGRPQASQARGVFRTTDGGRTWKRTLFLDPQTGVADMAWDERDPKIVYVAFTRFRGFGPRAPNTKPQPVGPVLYKSTDEGKTWKALSQQGLPANLRSATIAVADGTRGKVLYAEVQGTGRDAQGVYRSADGGKTWQLGTHQILSAGGRIYVDPSHANVVYLMGTALYRSDDGARSFVAIKGAPGGDDYRALWIDPTDSRRMLAGVDQGPTISVDGGATWTPWFNLPNGQFYHVSTDNQFPYWAYGAQQDSGTAGVRSRSDYGDIRTRDWYPVGGFEAGYIVVDPLHPRWVYTQGWYHVVRRFDRETGQVAVIYTPQGKDRFGSQPPMAYSPENPHTLYLGAQYLLATDDGGVTWRKLSPDLTVRTGPKPTGAAARLARFRPAALETLSPSALAQGEVWTGSSNGVIELTRDGGQTWRNVSPPGLPATASVVILDASHHDVGTAYAAIEEFDNDRPYLYRTIDFGAHWQAIVAGLPDHVRVRSIREDTEDSNLVFCGTEMGAWVSFDKGDHWQSLQLNLPNTVVSDLAIHGNDLVISTYGRGLWILDDITPLRQTAQAEAAQGVYLYRPESAWRVRWSNNHDTPLPPEVPAGQNPPEGAILDYYLPAPVPGPITLGIYDAAGNLVRQYSNTPPPPDTSRPNVAAYWFRPPVVLSPTAGQHRVVWDLRYPLPKALTYSYFGQLLDYTEYTLTWHAVKGETPRRQPVGPLAIPGEYQVRLMVNGQTYSQPLEIVNDPRVPISQEDLEAQLATEKHVMAGLDASYGAYYTIAHMRGQLAADLKPGGGNAAALVAASQALDKKLDALIRGTGNSGFGAANRDLGRRLQDLEFGDLRPPASTLAAIAASCEQIAAAQRTLAAINTHELATVNQLLAAAGRPTLAAPAAAGGCGQ